MKTIIIIVCLLFGFNTYAMQEPIKMHSIEYKQLSTKIDIKVAAQKKAKNDSLKRLKKTLKIIVIVYISVILLIFLL